MNFITSSLVAISSLTIPIQFNQSNMNMMALTPKDVEIKLDTIIVFTPTDENGIPKSFEFDVDGKKKNIYFAAFSPSALNFLSEKILTQSSDKDLKPTYSPKSLSKFNSLLKIEKEKAKSIKTDIIYIPIRIKEKFQKLLLEQGYKSEKIDNFVQNNPIIFCPSPTINATDKKTKISYIPCSTDYITMKGLADKTKIKKNTLGVKVEKPKVKAIPLTQFINTLKTSEEDNVKAIKVIPTLQV